MDSTPLMKQYWELKQRASDALMLFRMGDFYELFGDDAVEAAAILEITLTSRDKGKENPLPMAGVPHHSVQGYIQRLLKAGKKVAIAEQLGEVISDKPGKSIVKRDITRVFTPGVQFDHEGAESAYLAVALPSDGTPGSASWILACLDASTGEALYSSALPTDSLALELEALAVKHFLRVGMQLPEGARTALDTKGSILVEDLPSNYLAAEQSAALLKRHYGIEALDAFVADPVAVRALGILVQYAARTQQLERLAHLQLPQPLHEPRTMALGPKVAQHLDLLPSNDGTPSLYGLINKTRSALGARSLRRWVLEPLRAVDEIRERQEAVRELAGAASTREKLSATLAGLYDLERISGRVNTRLANPRDTLALGRSLAILPELSRLLAGAKAPLLRGIAQSLGESHAELEPLVGKILRSQRDDAPLVSRDGGIFNHGTTPELDRLLTLTEDGQKWLVELETREREATGIPSLKVRYNRVFGYYIEITTAHLKNAPAHYQRKQTTVGAERFFTEELKKFEDEIVTASARQKSMEQELFDALVAEIQTATAAVMRAARGLAELDCLTALAALADQPGWAFPVVDESRDFEIVAGRHPMVDAARPGAFVPNDLRLSPETRLTLLITGPNMGGKSTVMRQSALIVILGQLGAPVPAKEARWGAVSSLYTRIGAHDAIARGQSTFMVEMSELAHILHHADDRSLIVLDEIGRGTSTYDGISVAWATLEWICSQVRARTLFATHYHELTRLAGASLPTAANAHMAVEGARALQGGGLRFLYQLREGPANESFGIHVAQLAGLPKAVVTRAWSVLEELEAGARTAEAGSTGSGQLSLFAEAAPARREPSVESHVAVNDVESTDPSVAAEPLAPPAWLEALRAADLNGMTPIQALTYLAQVQESARTAQA